MEGKEEDTSTFAVTFRLFLARKLSLARALFYMVMQCLGAICGAGTVKWLQKGVYENNGGGASAAAAAAGYAKGNGLSAEILATFLFVGIAFYTTHPKTRARGSRFPIPANLPIASTVFLFHPIKIGTGINPANLPIGWLVPADSGRSRA